MKYSWAIAFVLLVGCAAEKPPAPAPPEPPDTIRIEPGAADADAPQEYTTTDSGLKYRILRKSDGKKPTEDSVIRFHYRGTLPDGTIFDSSYGKFGHAAQLPIKQLVKGFIEGMQLIGEGGMIEMTLPPELGYGPEIVGQIPANSTLHFIAELIEVK